MGVHKSLVSRWLSGEVKPTSYNLARISEMLAKLSRMTKPLSPEFSAAAKVLKELVTHHIDEEERNIWGQVKENFSGEDRAAMNRAFLVAKKKMKV